MGKEGCVGQVRREGGREGKGWHVGRVGGGRGGEARVDPQKEREKSGIRISADTMENS